MEAGFIGHCSGATSASCAENLDQMVAFARVPTCRTHTEWALHEACCLKTTLLHTKPNERALLLGMNFSPLTHTSETSREAQASFCKWHPRKVIFDPFFSPSTVIIVDGDIFGFPLPIQVMHSLGINFGDKIDTCPVVTTVTLNVHAVSLVILE